MRLGEPETYFISNKCYSLLTPLALLSQLIGKKMCKKLIYISDLIILDFFTPIDFIAIFKRGLGKETFLSLLDWARFPVADSALLSPAVLMPMGCFAIYILPLGFINSFLVTAKPRRKELC